MMMSTIRVKFVKKMKEKKKFLLYFWHISLSVHQNFEIGVSLDTEFNSTSNPYQHCILLRYPRHPKMKISIKKRILILKYVFYLLKIHFWVPWVPQKYALWVWVGCCIQKVPKLKIWVNP